MRMSIGRKMREYSQNALVRGYPKKVGNWIEYQKKQRTIIKDEDNLLKGYSSR